MASVANGVGRKKRPRPRDAVRGLMHYCAHRRPRYPSSSCFPAEPDSVSLGNVAGVGRRSAMKSTIGHRRYA